jgi:hypothetical protein
MLRRRYYLGRIFLNKYGGNEPTRVGCKYSDKSAEEGNASEEFVLLLEIFDGGFGQWQKQLSGNEEYHDKTFQCLEEYSSVEAIMEFVKHVQDTYVERKS